MPARDRRRPFWSKWVWKDWDAKTRDLSPVEYTAYHRLLSYAATSSADMCTIPDDDVRLARATGLGLKSWRRVRDRVLEFWPLCGSAGGFSTCVDGIPRRFNQRLLEDSSAFTQLSENNKSRVNVALSRLDTSGTTGVVPRARGLEVRSQKSEESKTPPHPPPAASGGAGPSRNGKNPDHIPIPEWLPAPLWADWCAFRRASKAPWTVKSATLSVARLSELRAQGHDPRPVIEQSILNGWRGLFALRLDDKRAHDDDTAWRPQ